MVRIVRTLYASAVVLLALLVASAEGSALAVNVSICDLARRANFYDHKIVTVRADVRGSGLHTPKLKDRKCLSALEISLGEDNNKHAAHLQELMVAIRSAVHQSTLERRRYVEAIFVGTFFAPSTESPNAELRLRDVKSIKIVEGNDLVPNIPPPPRH
jgi:hypothetical protein